MAVQLFNPVVQPYNNALQEQWSPQSILQAQGMQQQNALRGLQVQQETQSIQQQNALMHLSQQPGMRDDQGLPTPQFINALAGVAPAAANAAAKLRSDTLKGQAEIANWQAQADKHKAETREKLGKVAYELDEATLGSYMAAIQAGQSEQDALQTAAMTRKEKYDAAVKTGAAEGLKSPDGPVNPVQLKGNLFKWDQYQKDLKPHFGLGGVEGRPDLQQPIMVTPRGGGGFDTQPVAPPMTIPAMGAATIRAEAAPAKSPYTNVQPDGKGGMIGLNTQTGQVEQLPMAAGAQSKGSKEGLTVADKMNPVMLATVRLDVTEGKKAIDFMKKGELDEGSPFYASEHPGSAIARLAQKIVTPEKQQEFDVYANKLGQAIASAQSMGRGQISEAKINEAKKSIPVMGDSKKVRELKMQQLELFFKYVEDVLKTPIKADARTSEDDQQDVNDFSHLWK